MGGFLSLKKASFSIALRAAPFKIKESVEKIKLN